MNKNAKAVSIVLIGTLLFGVILFLARDLYLTNGVSPCGDPQGPRPKIDLRNFETNYTGYSVSLETEIVGKGKLSGRIEPASLQKLSESIQTGQEFRKALIAGYNACGVTRVAYQAAVMRFQSLDALARQIDALAAKPLLSEQERNAVARLIEEYSTMAEKLGDGGK